MEHDAWFFIGIFVFIFLIWIATGGPLHPISFSGPRLALPDALGGGTYLSFPRAPYTIGGSNTVLPGTSDGGGSISSGSGQSYPTLTGGTFGIPSPFRGKVSLLRYVSGAGSDNPNNEYLQLSVSQSAGGPVTLSGWTLVSDATKASSIIPQGSKLPTSGTINTVQNIVLAPGEKAIIISGRSPIGGSFAENKCIGYFSTFQTFTPQLPSYCPAAKDELARYYGPDYIRDGACIDYVNKIGRCQVLLSPPPSLSSTCQNFMIERLHYNGCVESHKQDADFFGDTWRIYLGRTTSMWRTKNEIVKLLDGEGKTVDAFSY